MPIPFILKPLIRIATIKIKKMLIKIANTGKFDTLVLALCDYVQPVMPSFKVNEKTIGNQKFIGTEFA